jgi:hypothetical protein
MTGVPDLNYPLFNATADMLTALGHTVENPASNEKPNDNPTWEDWMRLGITQLMRCNAMALLPGWRSSKGAGAEIWLAQTLGIPIFCIGHTDNPSTFEQRITETP